MILRLLTCCFVSGLVIGGCGTTASSLDPGAPENDAGASPDASGSKDASPLDAGDAGTGQDAGHAPDAGTINDAGTGEDAGHAMDAGDASAMSDASTMSDAGDASPMSDASSGDAGDGGDALQVAPPGQDPDVDHLPFDADGWTIFPTDYDVTIYVDSAKGSDANWPSTPPAAGNTMSTAIQSITKLQTVMGLSDYATKSMRVILKRGSSWPAAQFELPRGGLTADHPLLVSGSIWYDAPTDARPQIAGGIRIRNGLKTHVAMEGLEMGPNNGTTDVGFRIGVPNGTDYLIEDCVSTGFHEDAEILGDTSMPLTNTRIRRSQFTNAAGSGAAVGLDSGAVLGMLLEENVFDLNGVPSQADIATWSDYGNESKVGDMVTYSNALAHDIYFVVLSDQYSAFDIRLRGNFFSRTLQSWKAGATNTADNNVFYYFEAGGFIGAHGGTFSNNVLVHGGGAFGVGDDNAHFPNTDPSAVDHFYNNLFQHTSTALQLYGDSAGHLGAGVDFKANLIDDSTIGFESSDQDCFGLALANNQIQSSAQFLKLEPWSCQVSLSGNTYYSSAGVANKSAFYYTADGGAYYVDFATFESLLQGKGDQFGAAPFSYPDPEREIGGYLKASVPSLGSTPATLLGYINLVAARSKLNWDPNLSPPKIADYFRQGHGMTYLATEP